MTVLNENFMLTPRSSHRVGALTREEAFVA
jgi:hypothetical protein